jgi:hypothetical protein
MATAPASAAPWENDPVVSQQAPAATSAAPWENDPVAPHVQQAVANKPESLWDSVKGDASSALHSVEAVADGASQAIAVPFRPQYNLLAADNWLQSKLPSWLGGQSQATSQAQQAHLAQTHADAYGGGKFVGHTAEAALPLLIPIGGEALDAAEGADAATQGGSALARVGQWAKSAAPSIGINALSGLLSDPSHPVIGAASGAVLGTAQEAVVDKAAQLMAERAGLTPTLGTTNRLVRAIATKIAPARDAMTEFGKRDLWNAAVRDIGGLGDEDVAALTASKNGVPSIESVRTARNNLYAPVHASLNGTTITPSDELSTNLAQNVHDYQTNTLPSYQNPRVAQVATEIPEMAERGNLTGANALEAYKNIKHEGWDQDPGNTRNAMLNVAGTLRQQIANVSPEADAALTNADANYPKTEVLRRALQKSNGAQPSIPQMVTADRTVGDFSNNVGPFAAKTSAANELYHGKLGTSQRSGNLVSSLISESLPAIAGGAVEAHGGNGVMAWILSEAAEKGLGPVLGALANKTAKGGSSVLAQAIKNKIAADVGNKVSGN